MTDDATIRLAHGENPIAALRKAHKEQLLLCDRLEEIADSLPDSVNRQKCIYAARALGPMIRGVHRFEEGVVFPMIAERLSSHEDIETTLSRLRFEHCEDECFAEELTEALHALGAGRDESTSKRPVTCCAASSRPCAAISPLKASTFCAKPPSRMIRSQRISTTDVMPTIDPRKPIVTRVSR
jgi:hypothetical protein